MGDNKNMCIIAIGMSGTGKTTFVSVMFWVSLEV